MSSIVRSKYRYKRPPRKKKPVVDELPTIITIHKKKRVVKASEAAPEPTRQDGSRASAIVTPEVRTRRERLRDQPVGETDQAAAARYRALIISKLRT